MSDRPPLDPRFDPRFQRGYAGEAPVATTAQRGSRAAWPTPKVVADPAKLIAGPPRVVAPTVPAVEASGEHPVQVAEPLPRNPWSLALLIVSAAMILGGLAIAWYGVSHRSAWGTGTPVLDLFLMELSWILPSALLIAGSVGLVARLALAALWAGDRR